MELLRASQAAMSVVHTCQQPSLKGFNFEAKTLPALFVVTTAYSAFPRQRQHANVSITGVADHQ